MNSEAEKRFAATRTFLTLARPFYAVLLSHCSVVFTEEVATASINRAGLIRINPGFFLQLPSIAQCAFLLAHEVLHVALGIHWRSAHHQPERANRAHDYVINLLLDQDDPKWRIPGTLYSHVYAGMSYEEVYARLPAETAAQAHWCDVDLAAAPPCATPGEALSPEAQRDTWTARIIGAALHSHTVGRRSAAAEEIIAAAQTSVVSWQSKLRMALGEAFPRPRPNYSRPSRRSSAGDYFLPAENEVRFDVAVAVDTSGSVSNSNLSQALAEIIAIINGAGGQIRWLLGDAAVLADELISTPPTILPGRGGTSFVPFFEHLTDRPPRCRVFFTDTFGEFPAEPPAYPVVWAVYANAPDPAVPFGEVVTIPPL